MPKRDADSRRAALVDFMEARGLKPGPWAKDAGIPPTTIYGFLSGKSDDMGTSVYEALATVVGASVDHLLGHSDESRDRILAAGERLINEHGLDHVTIPMVCNAAEVRPSVFLSHFSGIKSMLVHILAAYNERSFADLRRLAPAYGSLTERISYVFRKFYEIDTSHTALTAAFHAFSWEWDQDLERSNQQQLSEFHHLIMGLFEDAAKQGKIARGDFRAASELLFAIYTQNFRKAVFDDATAEKLEAGLKPHIEIIIRAFKN